MSADVLVIGAGIVGAALGYGLAQTGQRVVVLDGEDRDMRAARANFGLVWVQGKGASAPAYHHLGRRSADLWPNFLKELTGNVGMKVDYSRRGGLIYCLGQNEYEERDALNKRMHNQTVQADTRMIDRAELERMMPAVDFGPEVVGASYCEADGHVNPLQLLAALHRGIVNLGGTIHYRRRAETVTPKQDGFIVKAGSTSFAAPRVVVAAGLATPSLTDPLGLTIPLRSERGQLLVTERLAPLLPYPGSGLRQTADGTIMIGATKEETDDHGVSVSSATRLALRATRTIPALASAKIVRQWSGFRIIPPDGLPIYAESSEHPGLFAAVCHSGVTLAAVHAAIIAPAMLAGRLSDDMSAFSNGRFDVQKCA
ncbi:FAD-binding oxidoreductase [Rhizobium sp. VS19-DR104.2]|uniref:NAD(P)/FAD-dependent oxidoreductase n=1 Tax=unclassified Rhizobium TaxID=2613769 RepID=UPI001C5AE977|nr:MULTISPECIES: FAD-dependent oxidoreductase [unclassified Rhizobium]MBZ5763549.1 FAD-binding oxidoreductase [Rhizobium sp. VS19-DR96]MBZ5769472.1 FAD-binding oxidoreductase [Rhizobium sp. VS19-DR129.2]MBZ5777015.1 FAD-binding oxidoreductase [Rhizobium sp. VS19-DRK62.2]MBZ5788143.1 FAD-binding oxidoreductase [Rhizobium sp. VS19-DR121]MBZ5805598.1 FAD-binding oxidoreductase [Rhizobium sp. VS19-DR181]